MGSLFPTLRIHSLVSWSSARYLSMPLASACEIEPTAFNFWDLQGKATLKYRYQCKQNAAGCAALPFYCLQCEVKNCSSLQIQQVEKQSPSEVIASAEEQKAQVHTSIQFKKLIFFALQMGWWCKEKSAKAHWKSPVVIMWGVEKGCTTFSLLQPWGGKSRIKPETQYL